MISERFLRGVKTKAKVVEHLVTCKVNIFRSLVHKLLLLL